jgi:hypothetical protein
MQEAYDQDKGSINAKMWGYTSFDATAPYDMFDFRVSRHRDGPEEFLAGYAGHVMADCYSGNMSVILARILHPSIRNCLRHDFQP